MPMESADINQLRWPQHARCGTALDHSNKKGTSGTTGREIRGGVLQAQRRVNIGRYQSL